MPCIVTGPYPIRQIVEFCFAYEFQFEVTTERTRVLVTFNKGIWEILFVETKDVVEMSDDPAVRTCTNPIHSGFLVARLENLKIHRMENGQSWSWDHAMRDIPSRVLTDLILLVGGEIKEVHVLQEGRNGYIQDGKIVLHRKDW